MKGTKLDVFPSSVIWTLNETHVRHSEHRFDGEKAVNPCISMYTQNAAPKTCNACRVRYFRRHSGCTANFRGMFASCVQRWVLASASVSEVCCVFDMIVLLSRRI